MKYIILLIGLLCALPAMAADAPSRAPAKLSEQDKTDIARLESYLNKLKSVSADFLQVNDSGELRHGKITILRPGKMRVAYDPPSQDLIIADGTLLHTWDAELKQPTSVPVGSTLAEFILRDPIKLGGDVTITRLSRESSKIEVGLVSTKDQGEGELTLIFEDKPLKLRQWRVVDTSGRVTGVSLENAREGVTLDPDQFHFVPPTLGSSRANQR